MESHNRTVQSNDALEIKSQSSTDATNPIERDTDVAMISISSAVHGHHAIPVTECSWPFKMTT